MKTNNDQNDTILDDFFSEMKLQDARQPLPQFEELVQQKKQKSHWLPWIAASVVVVLASWFIYEEKQVADPVIIELSLSSEEVSTASLAVSEHNMYEWESPTQSLITDF